MKLTKFDGVNKDELSMIEVAHEILEQKGSVMDFNDLLIEVQEFLELSENELERKMSIFYTEMNTDGSFISLGGNRWGLRSWYPLDSIDEELASFDDEATPTRRKKRKKLNAFATSDDDLDYSNDDPEDDMDDSEDEEDIDDLDDDNENEELSAYHNDLDELNEDDDTEDEASADEDLSIVSDESLFEDM